jgi:hypothetical protein
MYVFLLTDVHCAACQLGILPASFGPQMRSVAARAFQPSIDGFAQATWFSLVIAANRSIDDTEQSPKLGSGTVRQ